MILGRKTHQDRSTPKRRRRLPALREYQFPEVPRRGVSFRETDLNGEVRGGALLRETPGNPSVAAGSHSSRAGKFSGQNGSELRRGRGDYCSILLFRAAPNFYSLPPDKSRKFMNILFPRALGNP